MDVSPGRLNYPLSRQRQEQDAEPYSTALVEDLLGSLNEWRSVQDVVRLTLKALTDTVKSQGIAIKDLERQLPSKATKAELNSGLAVKANVTDMERLLSDITAALDSKVTLEDTQTLLEDKVSQSDLQYAVSSRVSFEEVRAQVEGKVDLRDFEAEIRALSSHLTEWKREVSERMQTSATLRDLQKVQDRLDTKADKDEMNEALLEKANKASVANALHRKANRADIDLLLGQKADLEEVRKLQETLKGKAEFGMVDKMLQTLAAKADKLEVSTQITQESLKLTPKSDLENAVQALTGLKKELDQRFQQTTTELRTSVSNWQLELEKTQSSLSQAIGKKVDIRDFDQLAEMSSRRPDQDQVGALLADLRKEVQEGLRTAASANQEVEEMTRSRLHEIHLKMESETHRLEDDQSRLKESLRSLSERTRADLDSTYQSFNSNLSSTRQDLVAELRSVQSLFKEDLSALATAKADSRDLQDAKTGLLAAIETRALAAELSVLKAGFNKDLSSGLSQVQQSLSSMLDTHHREIAEAIDERPSRRDIASALEEKLDYKALTVALDNRPAISDFAVLREQLEEMRLTMRLKAENSDLEAHIKYTRGALEEVSKDILQKSSIKDVCNLLDQKANIDDVNKALEELHQATEQKLALDEFRAQVADQGLINEALCAENCVGRWIWKTGEVRTGYAVPWEVQSVNTCPDNFLWEKDKTSILAIAPGLYEVVFGFFSRKRPVVQLLVNGEAVMSEGGQAYPKQILRHSSGNIAGLTSLEFVALPARSRVSVTYSGEAGAEGFIGLRKL